MSNHTMSDQTGFDAPLTTEEGLNAPRVTQSDFANATLGAPLNATEPAPPAETPVPDAPAETPPLVAPPETPPPSEPTPVEPTPAQPDVPLPMIEPNSPPQPDEFPPVDPVVQ